LLAPLGQLERVVEHALATAPCYAHGIDCRIRIHLSSTSARPVQAFGLLAHDHKVDLLRTRIAQWPLNTGNRADGAYPGVQIKRQPNIELRCDLGTIGIAHLGQAHCTEQNRISALHFLHRLVAEGDAGIPVSTGTPRQCVPHERRTVQSMHDRVDDQEANGHHFRADAVTRQHRNAQVGSKRHPFSS
jgi:hypothetical protein